MSKASIETDFRDYGLSYPLCKVKRTNADRIRSMSDDELAEFIEQISADSMDTISFGTKDYEEIWEHKETALKWLQSEVEEEHGAVFF